MLLNNQWITEGIKQEIRNYLETNENKNTKIQNLWDAVKTVIAQLVKNSPGSIPGLGRSAGEGIGYPLQYSWASLVAQLVKNPPAMWETWVQSLGWIRKKLPTPVFWPGEFHGLYNPWGCKESDTTKQLSLSLRKQGKLQINN